MARSQPTDVDPSTTVDTAEIYGHRGGNGRVFVTVQPAGVLESLDIDGLAGFIDRVEAEWFTVWPDDRINDLTPEPERDGDPARIGTLHYNLETGAYIIDIHHPDTDTDTAARVPDVDAATCGYTAPDAYASHIRRRRQDQGVTGEALRDTLADLNQQALDAALQMERAADALEYVAEMAQPMNAMDLDLDRMADLAAWHAAWFEALADAYREEYDRLEA